MIIEDLLAKRNMTKYRLAVAAEVPHATLNDICSGKTRLEKCSAETVYKLAKALDVSMEMLTEGGIRETKRERSFEYGLPDYLQHDLDAYKGGAENEIRHFGLSVGRTVRKHQHGRDQRGRDHAGTRRLPAAEVSLERGGRMNRNIDFTGCRRVPGKAYYLRRGREDKNCLCLPGFYRRWRTAF